MSKAFKEPLISIIILSCNRYVDIYKSLQSIGRLNYTNIELIIIDNNSTCKKTQNIYKEFPNYRYIYLNDNMGTSKTRNAGAAFSKGKFIWFLDNDTEITNADYIEFVLNKFENNPKIGAIGGEAILDVNKKINGVKALYLQKNGMTNSVIFNDKYNTTKNVNCLASCNLFIRRSVFNEVGGFDPWYFFYLEDLDLTYRIYLAGYELVVVSKTPIIHWFSQGERKTPWVGPYKNRMYFVLKNYKLINVLTLPFIDIFYLLKPSNFSRLINYTRKVDLGAKAFIMQNSSKKNVTIGKMFKGVFEALKLPISMMIGYIAIIPHLSDAILSRGKNRNYIEANSIKNNIKFTFPDKIS